MEAEAADRRPDSPARTLLVNQNRLVLWQIASERAGAALKMLTGGGILIAAIVLAMFVWDAHREDGLVIQAFSVPPDLAERGITGKVVASKLLDDLAELQNATESVRASKTYANNWTGDIKIVIPQTGVSIGELHRSLVEWLGHQTTIDGEVYRTKTGLVLAARTGTEPAREQAGSEADLDALVQAAAEDIYEKTQPYRYSIFLADKGDAENLQRAMALQEKLTRTGSREDRMWAYIGLTNSLVAQGDFAGAIRAASAGIALEPKFSLAYVSRADAQSSLGHDEMALADQQRAVASADRYGKRFHAAAMGRSLLAAWNGRLHMQRGAYAVAHQNFVGAPGYADPSVRLRYGVPRLAWAHEIERARADWAQFKTAGSPAAADDQAVVETEIRRAIAYSLGDWRALAPLYADFDPNTLPVEDRLAGQHQWAFALAKAGQIDRGRAVIAATPLDCYRCLIVRGVLASMDRDWPVADRWFGEAVRQGPSLPFAYSQWGESKLSRGDVAGAVTQFQMANLKSPHFVDALELWGEALMRKGDFAAAVEKFKQAQQDAPHWGRLHMKWGEALAQLGKFDEARAQLQLARGLELAPADRAELNRQFASVLR